MAKGNPLAQQAAAYASAAVPTVGSINSQYNQSQGDVHNFTNALVKLLQSGGQQDPYAQSVGSQTAANQAAVQRLTNLGSPYAAGSAAAVGAMGDSALGSLNQQRGAAIQYQRQLPGIAAARGQLANSSLITARHTALDQRNQQYQSAYMQALQQLRDYGLQKQQLKQSAQQFNAQLRQQNAQFAANQAYQYAALNQRSAEFKSSQGQQWRETLLQAASQAGGQTPTGALSGFTPLQVHSMLTDAAQGAQTAASHGIGIEAYLRRAVAVNNIPKPLALLAVKKVYGSFGKSTKQYKMYQAWVNKRLFADQVNAGPKNQRNPHPPGR